MKKLFLVSLLVFHTCYAPPVDNRKKEEESKEAEVNGPEGLEDYMEYHRYLREVVNALESDPDFRQKLEKANEDDIRSGKIAHELEFVSHNVRTRLDEIKRSELERLKHLMEQKRQLQNNEVNDDPSHHHLDHSNPHTFEIEDLKKLIDKTTKDLAEADKKRREEFKQYELQKEFEKQQKLNTTNEEEKEKLEQMYKEQEEKHKKHEPLHEPGHKKQLEEVWEEQDHMQQEFDPKTFFALHDLDSNGLWDENEVKALFIKELDKMYQAGHPEDDMRERVEEMERMREAVFKEVDVNGDGFIDFDEFLAQTKRNTFEQDNGWQGLDEQKPYSDEELQQYIRMHQAQQMPPHGYPPQPPPGYNPNQHYQNPNGPPPGAYNGHNQPPPGYYNGPPVPHPAYINNEIPQGNYYPQGQVHPQQAQQMPNMQLNTNEIYPHQQQQQQQFVPQVHNPNVPVQNPQVPVSNQNVPPQLPNVPVKQQQPSVQQQNVQPNVPIRQNAPVQQNVPAQHQTVQNQQQIPVQNQQQPPQAPVQNQNIPAQPQNVPVQNKLPNEVQPNQMQQPEVKLS